MDTHAKAVKNIVLCSDGTGNRDIKARGSNVFKLYEAVHIQRHKTDPSKCPQVAIYDEGVGTESLLPLKILGGAFGAGFSANVRELYARLAHAYVPGDRLYLFGFSRGAYTIRALAGMIQYCGIVDVNNARFAAEQSLKTHVKQCWSEFHKAAFTTERDYERMTRVPECNGSETGKTVIDGQTADRRRRLLAHEPDAPINLELVGVWDTVGAVGMPVDQLKHLTDVFWRSRFKDLVPGREIKRARHALALDDERKTFWPELWNETGNRDRRIEQVWFAGAHSNVGGGYPKHGMSLVALDWMMSEAEDCGLEFIPADRQYVHNRRDVHDKLYDSRAGFGMYYRWAPRNVPEICGLHGITRPKVHVSVYERIALGTDGYAPGNLPFDCEVVTTAGSPWPVVQRMRRVEAEVGSRAAGVAGNNQRALLDGAAGSVVSGQCSHFAFLVTTALGLWGLADPPAWLRVCTASEWYCEPRVPVIAAIVLAGLIIWAWANRVDANLDRRFAGFWHGLRERLRSLL